MPHGEARLGAITLLAAALILAPVALLAVLTTRTVDEQLSARGGSERDHTADVAARLVDARLATGAASLQLLGRRPSVRESLARRDAAELAQILADLRAVSSLYASAAAFGADGTMLARDPDGGTNGTSFATRDYFRGAVAASAPFVSEAYRSLAPPYGPLVAIAYGVRDGATLMGVLQVTLAPADVLEIIDAVGRLPGRTVVVVDEADRVIASTDAVFTLLEPSGLDRARGTSGDGQSFRAAIDGQARSVSPAALSAADWTLYVLDDPAVALAVQRDVERNLATGAAVSALVAVLVGVFLAFLYEQLASQRDALAVTRAELTSANEGLAAAGRYKSEFLANMSHELRTPLNAILGFSQLLEEQLAATLSDRQRRHLRNVHDAGSHLLALINDVLDLSKVESGRVELRPERSSAHTAAEPVLSAARAAADSRGVRLDAAVESASLDVDVGRLRQILYNLLSNAVKFTPAGGRVGARIWTAGRDLHVEVADTGIGIPADRQSRVFGVFERVNEDRSESSGTGLGLALTRQLVDLHGGAISFRSVEGEGTTFSVTLPGIVADPIDGDRVLVVEDDPRAAELTAVICAGAGLRTEVATTVTAALDAARRATPIAVLLDLQLANERGEAVLRELRASGTTRSIPIAITSVEDDDGQSRALGADEYFRKPVDQKLLAEWLSRVATTAAVPSAA